MRSSLKRIGASRHFERQRNFTSQNQTNATRYHLSLSDELSTPEARLQVRIRFYQERLESPSDQVPRTAGCIMGVPAFRVGHGQTAKKFPHGSGR